MKYLKLYENFADGDLLIDIVKKQALQLNKPEMLEYAIDQGFDLDKHKRDLIEWCEEIANYRAIIILDREYYYQLIKKTTELDISGRDIETLDGIYCLINLEVLDCSENELTSLKGIENLTKLKKLNCSDNPLPEDILEMHYYEDQDEVDKYHEEYYKEHGEDAEMSIADSLYPTDITFNVSEIQAYYKTHD